MRAALCPQSPVPAERHSLLTELLSPDGRVRERALKRITPGNADAAIWQAVLLRLNDWAPQVRAAAWQALQRLLPQWDFATALQVLPALRALERGQRAHHGDALELVRHSLRKNLQDMDAAQRQSLHVLVRRGAPAQAVFCFDALLDWALHAPGAQALAQVLAQVLASGLVARQPTITRRAVQWVHKLPSAELRQSLYEQALRTPHIRTRLSALRALSLTLRAAHGSAAAPSPGNGQALWPNWLQAALLDASPSVRYLAIQLCGGPGEDLLAHATATLHRPDALPRQRAAALGLLADLALPQGRPLALAALDDASVRVRCAAYAAAYRLQAQAADALTLRALQDPARAVFRVARLHTERSGNAPTLEMLWPHMRGESAEHWLRLLKLSRLGDAWNHCIVLLSVPRAALGDEARAARLFQPLAARWLAVVNLHCFVQPTDAQRQRIRALLPVAPLPQLFGRAKLFALETVVKDLQLDRP
ncbi:hypothetical protein CLI92_02265 [Vandammella animalimorsus]|uniref:Uncharacterized protein n=2 Tax=Vandammella animalimorsus TaxID=2029117 RepID=A0A2A2T8W9_9BURK|nr:hypothetical protein CLI92_02265 [Vandammella animalimorsus]PAX20802.1 hypothetical protein CLI93_03690 [Vandammella animalimorsus]